MNSFISFAAPVESLLHKIIASDEMHMKWLNTLSYLENCGARKIAACQHPTMVKEEVLKHAAEEFRHAHYLKKQMSRISNQMIPDFSRSSLLGGTATLHYLSALDLKTSRYLTKEIGLNREEMTSASYLLVTYAIELRAREVYDVYDQLLRKLGAKVTIKSIFLEEMEHLKEMETALEKLPHGFVYANKVCSFESIICREWLVSIDCSRA